VYAALGVEELDIHGTTKSVSEWLGRPGGYKRGNVRSSKYGWCNVNNMDSKGWTREEFLKWCSSAYGYNEERILVWYGAIFGFSKPDFRVALLSHFGLTTSQVPAGFDQTIAFTLSTYDSWLPIVVGELEKKACPEKPAHTKFTLERFPVDGLDLKGDHVTAHIAQQKFCETKGGHLPTYDDICPNGEGKAPALGCTPAADHSWIPYSKDSNSYAYIGCDGHSGIICKDHVTHHGNPSWIGAGGDVYGSDVECMVPDQGYKCHAEDCLDWDCATWCKCFEEEKEDDGTYAAAGCVDDGDDDCTC
jgi:hypothetical protein